MKKFTKIIRSISVFCAMALAAGVANAACLGTITLDNETNGGTGITTAYVGDNYVLYSDSGCRNTLSEPTKSNAKFAGYYKVSDNFAAYTSCTNVDFKWKNSSNTCPLNGTTYYARFDCNTGYGMNGSDKTCVANCAPIGVTVSANNEDGYEEYVLSKWYDRDTLYNDDNCEQAYGNKPLNVGVKPNATFLGFFDSYYPDEKCMAVNANNTFKNWLSPIHTGLACNFTGGTYSSDLVAYYQCTNGDVVSYDDECPACLKITLNPNDGSNNMKYIYRWSDNKSDLFSDSNCQTALANNKAPVPDSAGFKGFYTSDGKALCIAKSGSWLGATRSACAPDTDIILNAQYDGITCAAGTYLPRGATTCDPCPAGFYCVGGTFQQDPDNAQGRESCSSGEYNPEIGSTSRNACIKCPNTYQGQTISPLSRTYASSILDCSFLPNEMTFSDETGTYKFQSGTSCYYAR